MKAVVTKIDKRKAIVLTVDGSFVCVPNKGYVPGQEIYINYDSKTLNFSRFKRGAAAAAAIFLVFISGFLHVYNIPKNYISIDINPSIVIETNMFNKVINADGINSDGETVLEKLEIKNISMERAVELIISQSEKEGYLNSAQNDTVLVGIHCDNEDIEEEVIKSVQLHAKESLKQFSLSATVTTKSVSQNSIDKANAMGITAGKLELINKYINAAGLDIDPMELVSYSVSEIAEFIENIQNDDTSYEEPEAIDEEPPETDDDADADEIDETEDDTDTDVTPDDEPDGDDDSDDDNDSDGDDDSDDDNDSDGDDDSDENDDDDSDDDDEPDDDDDCDNENGNQNRNQGDQDDDKEDDDD